MRIAIAGFQHETNTFAPTAAGVKEFTIADSWPGLLLGPAVIAETKGMNLPIAGAAAQAQQAGMDLVPICWCAAEPSGPVTDQAFDWASEMIIDGLARAMPLDGLYLDLHGAMVSTRFRDGEGELLRRLRARVGPDFPIAVSLDLHANISADLVAQASVLTVYRSYPHLDMAATGARAVAKLRQVISDAPFAKAFRQADFLVPLHAQFTGADPCRGLYRRLEEIATHPDEHVELAMGFTAADVFDCGPSVIAYATSQHRADALADDMMCALNAARPQFDTRLLTPAQAFARAKEAPDGKPTVIADVQDNPGAGGSADSTGVLQSLIEGGARDAVLGVICDPEIAAQAHRLGAGAVFNAPLGGKTPIAGQQPVQGQWRVLALSDGVIRYGGEMYGGGEATLGPACLLALQSDAAGVQVVVSSIRIQCLDQALFTHFGVELSVCRLIAVKSTVHYRADFDPIAGLTLPVAAPGLFNCAPEIAQYTHLRPGVGLLPNPSSNPRLPDLPPDDISKL